MAERSVPWRLSVVGVLGLLSLMLFVLLPSSSLAADDPCPSHPHDSGVVMDCAASISVSGSTVYGSAVTETQYTNAEVEVEGAGKEVCWGDALLNNWNDESSRNNARIASVSGSGMIFPSCGSLAWLAVWSFHEADGADLHHNSKNIPHPNRAQE